MSIYKRGDVYWYKFMWQGKLVRDVMKTDVLTVSEDLDQEAVSRVFRKSGYRFCE